VTRRGEARMLVRGAKMRWVSSELYGWCVWLRSARYGENGRCGA
jgi:hypothetical protein